MKEPPPIEKSSRHQKIIGAFGEHLICNWLSRSGFEVTIVDHTGIDIVAYDPRTKARIGITVKSRTRSPDRESSSVTLLSYRKATDDRVRVMDACKAFDAEPWLGVYVETTQYAEVYLTSLSNYDAKYRGSASRAIDDWKMTPKHRQSYAQDADVKHIHMDFSVVSWNWSSE